VDAQQFADILDKPATDANGDPSSQTLRDILSTNAKEIEINNALLAQAEADAPLSGYQTQQFFTLAVDPNTGKPVLQTADQTAIDASFIGNADGGTDASAVHGRAVRSGYVGYLLGDGVPPNGVDFGHGINFPASAHLNDYYLRTDFMPNRLFRYDGTRWVKTEDAVRMTMSNTDTKQTLKTSFINNTASAEIGGEVIVERQALSKALKPKADL